MLDLFTRKKSGIVSAFVPAGFPKPDTTPALICQLAASGVDLIELGMPYSDPLADGPVIQHANQIALRQGQTMDLLFDQMASIRKVSDIPIMIMGYYNPFLQYGAEKFLRKAAESGVQGLILPDLPMEYFEKKYAELFEKYHIATSFLISPDTKEERIHLADRLSTAFLYVVSDFSVTGRTTGFSALQLSYFERIRKMGLHSPQLLGFGISDQVSLETATTYFRGGIIGSAFIRFLEEYPDTTIAIQKFCDHFGIHETTDR